MTLQRAPRRELIGRLRRAMSSTQMMETLRRHWDYPRRRGLRVVDCRLARVHPLNQKGFMLEYDIGLRGPRGDRRQRVFAQLPAGGAERHYREVIDKLRNPSRSQLAAGAGTDLISCLADPGLVLRLPGLDERLAGLKLVHDTDLRRTALSQFTHPVANRAPVIDVELLGHRLGKRCVVRFCFDPRRGADEHPRPRSVVAKIYKRRSRRAGLVFATTERLRADGFGGGSDVRVPRPLDYLEDWQTVLMEDAPGVQLLDLRGPARGAGARASGRALAKLHGSSVRMPTHYSVDDEITLLRKWVALVSEVVPGRRARMLGAFDAVATALDTCRGGRTALVHRDFYDKQVLVDGGRTTIIDFDTLCVADPALDVGNFLAHLRLARLQGDTDVGGLDEAFIAGYGDLSAGAAGRVAAYTKSSLLRLACLHSFSPRPGRLAEPLLEALDGRDHLPA